MKNTLFNALDVYHDTGAQSAAMNMAIDEALLEYAAVSSIRFYHWHSPALSFGYFGKFADVARYERERDLVRRWTGGGIVFHGHDLTYSIVIPAHDTVFSQSSMSIYERVHYALRDALGGRGTRAVVAEGLDGSSTARQRNVSAGCSCFANPVRADVLIDDRKIAGAAQRRSARGLLQQGSIQGVDVGNGLAERFAEQLSKHCEQCRLPKGVQCRALEIAAGKYATDAWLHRR